MTFRATSRATNGHSTGEILVASEWYRLLSWFIGVPKSLSVNTDEGGPCGPSTGD